MDLEFTWELFPGGCFLLRQGSRSSLDAASCRSVDSARPVGQVDRHIQLMVHGVAPAGKCYGTWHQWTVLMQSSGAELRSLPNLLEEQGRCLPPEQAAFP